MDSPNNAECDAMREDVALLVAENRRLVNKVIELCNKTDYPEAAVRAVWEYGQATSMYYHEGERIMFEQVKTECARIFTEALQKGG